MTKIQNIKSFCNLKSGFRVSGLGFRVFRAARGFTMVEVVIMLAIIILISSGVLVSFPSTLGTISTQVSAQRLALALRQAQNQALAVRTVEGPDGPVVPKAVGIRIDLASPTNFLSFADMNLNKIYDPLDIIILETDFEREVRVVEILDETGRNQSVINIVFVTPTADMNIFNEADTIGQSAAIGLRSAGGELTRRVLINISGQISIE